jgi:hypothetical protein
MALLGAAPAGVIRLVTVRISLLVGVGVVIGPGLSLWASKFVASLLYGLGPRARPEIHPFANPLAFRFSEGGQEHTGTRS